MRNFLKNSQNSFQILLKFYSKFISSFLWISFRIYLKSLRYFLKCLQHAFQKIFLKFVHKCFQKFPQNLVKISIKFYLRIAPIFCIVYTKISRKFSPFWRFSTNFHYNFIAPQYFHNQLMKIFCDCSSIFL